MFDFKELAHDSWGLVEELLENREYFSDIQNAFIDEGPEGFDGESLRATVEALGDTFYQREIDLEKVEWYKAAVYLNEKLEQVS